jgi:hypothetical protein
MTGRAPHEDQNNNSNDLLESIQDFLRRHRLHPEEVERFQENLEAARQALTVYRQESGWEVGLRPWLTTALGGMLASLPERDREQLIKELEVFVAAWAWTVSPEIAGQIGGPLQQDAPRLLTVHLWHPRLAGLGFEERGDLFIELADDRTRALVYLHNCCDPNDLLTDLQRVTASRTRPPAWDSASRPFAETTGLCHSYAMEEEGEEWSLSFCIDEDGHDPAFICHFNGGEIRALAARLERVLNR